MRLTIEKTVKTTVSHSYRRRISLSDLRLALTKIARHAPKVAHVTIATGPEGAPIFNAETTITASWRETA